MKSKSKIVGGVAALVAVAGIGIGAAVTSTPGGCAPSPQAAISALPPDGTFTGTGCYTVPGGLTITKPVTIDGGTYNDPSATLPGNHSGGLAPVITVSDTSNVTIKNAAVTGGDPSGNPNGSLANQAGIAVFSSSGVTLDSDSTEGTFGDGVELFEDLGPHHPKPVVPDTDITIDALTVTRAGRHCFTPIAVTASTFTGIDCVSSDTSSVDMESDIPPVGAGNLTFDHLTAPKGINIIEHLSGPLVFTATTFGHQFHTTGGTIDLGGTATCQREAFPSCVLIGGGVTTLAVAFAYEPGIAKITEAEYKANPPGQIVGS